MSTWIVCRRLAAAWVVLHCVGAFAADWKDSFPPSAVATYFEGSKRTVMVVAAGEPVADSKLAAAAFEAGLRACGKASLVLNDAALKISPTAGDAEVVKAAAAQPVELIAVVRVFDGSTAGAQNAVITLYDKGGAAQLAFTAVSGRPLIGHQGSGVDVGLAGKGPTAKAATQIEQQHQRTYDQKFLWLDKDVPADAKFSSANQGRFGTDLKGADFYTVVGRPDLASAYYGRKALKTVVILGGVLSIVGAHAIFLSGELFNPCVRSLGSPYGTCLQRARGSQLVPAAVVGGGGLAALVVGIALPNRHVLQGEARKLADEYNTRLKKEIDTEPVTAESKLRLELVPMLDPTGAGLMLGGAF